MNERKMTPVKPTPARINDLQYVGMNMIVVKDSYYVDDM